MYFNPENIHKYYCISEEIGRGGFSIVKKAINIETGDAVAIKIIEKNDIGIELEHLKCEMEIMRLIETCPQVISFYEAFEDEEAIYLVLELVDGGNMLDMVVSQDIQKE